MSINDSLCAAFIFLSVIIGLDFISTAALATEPFYISVSELRAKANLVRNFRAKDQFDVGPDIGNIVGRKFEVEITARPTGISNTICAGTPDYSYYSSRNEFAVRYGNKQKLSDYYNPLTHSFIQDRYSPPYSIYSFDCSVTRGKPFVGGNAFGAVTLVKVRKENFLALAMSLPQSQTEIGGTDWTSQMSPDSARTLARLIRVRIHGTIGEWRPGRPIECGWETENATMDNPETTQKHGCFVNVMIDRVDLINSKTGDVLQTNGPD